RPGALVRRKDALPLGDDLLGRFLQLLKVHRRSSLVFVRGEVSPKLSVLEGRRCGGSPLPRMRDLVSAPGVSTISPRGPPSGPHRSGRRGPRAGLSRGRGPAGADPARRDPRGRSGWGDVERAGPGRLAPGIRKAGQARLCGPELEAPPGPLRRAR